jgi:hypothetical protein
MSEMTPVLAEGAARRGLGTARRARLNWIAGLAPRRRRGGRSLYGRLVGFVGVFLALWAVSFFGSSLVSSWLARVDYYRLAHPDRSVAESAVRSQVRPRVALVYRTEDGRRVRVLADQEAFSDFVRSSAGRLEAARTAMQARAPGLMAAALQPTVADLDARVEDFADWYFAWSTSYRLMGRAAGAAAANVLRPSAMDLSEAVGYELSRYLQRQYSEIVLQPERTDPRLEAQFRDVLETLHGQYLGVMAGLDADFQAFVTEHTTHLDERLPVGDAGLTIDWDSHLHKVSVAGHERGGLEVARGVGLVAAGGMVGRTVGAATIKRAGGLAARGLLPRMAAPYLGRATTVAAGAGTGALAGPVGVVVGGAAGLGVDYLINEGVELLQRDDFESSVRESLAVTEEQIQSVMAAELERAVHIWFDDSVQLLAAYE